jgi:polyketide cyclase/dehydrase/lipid transport protein
MAWQFQHTAESSARPADVWRRYVDVPNWPEWSQKGVERAHLDGPFEVGTTGKSKPPGMPGGSFRLIEVQPEAKFASESRLPGGRMLFEHVIEPSGEGVRITHRATIDGPLAFLYTAIARRSIERGLPDGVERLAGMAAADASTARE